MSQYDNMPMCQWSKLLRHSERSEESTESRSAIIGRFFAMLRMTLFLFICIQLAGCTNTKAKEVKCEAKEEVVDKSMKLLLAKAEEAEAYCKEHKMNTEVCFLIDMSIHSGKHRLFVWDFKKQEILFSGLCCHGVGGKSTQKKPEFSNVSGSNCTSIGKYKLGIRSYSNWGINIHYKMHGLEETNDNAYKRIVVFHSHTPVPEREIYPIHLPLGWSQGCPVVSNNTMRQVDELLQKIGTKEPALMWIYVK